MADTYTLISSVTVGSGGASSIDFTSIPATYTDLKIVASLRDNFADTENAFIIKFNNSSTSDYDVRTLFGRGGVGTFASASSTGQTSLTLGDAVSNTATASTFNNAEIYIPNYAGSTNKSVSSDIVTEQNASRAIAKFAAGLRTNTAAITQITLTATGSASFVQYSTAYLYGIKNS